MATASAVGSHAALYRWAPRGQGLRHLQPAHCSLKSVSRVAQRAVRSVVMQYQTTALDVSSPALASVAEQKVVIRESMQWFRVPPKVYFKGGCLEVAMAELEGRKRALIVTDQTVFDMSLTEHVVACLDRYNIQNQIYTHVPSEPTEKTINEGLREIQDFRPDIIVAVGGGSPMDAAKLMWLLYEVPSTNLQEMIIEASLGRSRLDSIKEPIGKKALCICVPTTSGTGAEVTPFAVIKDPNSGRKITLANYALTPSMAIVDPQLVLQLPAAQTAYGGALTLSHALESYISVFASEYTWAQSKHAMSMLARYYARAYHKGNTDFHAREKMHNAATVAGMAFANTYLGACHALASEISSVTGHHMGLVSGALLPSVLAFMASRHKATKELLADLADHLHVGGSTVDQRYDYVMNWVESMRAAGEIPTSLQTALGPGPAAVLKIKQEAVCQAALLNAHMVAAPVEPTLDDLKGILTASGL